ncbi:Arylsulfatase precursor [Novipirellula galeiformis]|uniref:Arylsulfatase n=1 Tax=Novipirellula galeiformis TaxID=2528004 RepID=A0A5C6CEL3_9BACT|nr:sulfatase-like hydrolase/transferase [Novipirellula galeiformis]TWU23050.1 Arylsulfatase precursor [Novipirellula galeiformis]
MSLPFRLNLFVALWCAMNAEVMAEVREPTRRPNLVLILADDLGYGDVSCHGARDIQTPHLDTLASEGMMLTRMRANCTVCSPTRAAILTGMYADRVGVPGVIRTDASNSWGYLRHDIPTLADRLREVGYETGIVGKWHLGLTSPNTPLERGFNHFHGFLGDMMDDYYTHRRHGQNYMRNNNAAIEPAGHASELFTNWAVDYVSERAEHAGTPFFLYLAYNAPHFPIQPPAEWLDRVQKRSPNLDPKRALNVAFVEHLDDQIGRLMQRLDELGLRENTVVAFTSDNGGSLPHAQNNDPWRDGKQSHYEGGLRVPCWVRYPGHIQPGSKSDHAALTFDLGATFLQYAGAEHPDDSDAIRLKGVLEGRAQQLVASASPRELYFVRREGGHRYVGHAYHAIIRGRWKLMQNHPFSALELYDLKADPQETKNVFAENPKVVADLKKRLAIHLQRGGQVPWQPGQANVSDSAANAGR